MTIRERFEKAIAGEVIERPIYAAYDFFIEQRNLDWDALFQQGLGKIYHANLLECRTPNVDVVKTQTSENGQVRTDITWITDKGELHEYFVGDWRQEYLIKSANDYKLMAHALSDSEYSLTETVYDQYDELTKDSGITLGQLGPLGLGRTPFQKIQIDYAGLHRFSMDIAYQTPELLELLELMNSLFIEQCKCIIPSKVSHVKLWENLSIITMGPVLFRQHLVPLYKKMLETLEGTNKKIMVHYDGKLALIAKDIAELEIDGIDSLTPPPEGDLAVSEARTLWPHKFLWLHPSLSWFHASKEKLADNMRQLARDAGPARYCMMLSEEIPPHWERTIPTVLEALNRVET